MKFFEKTTIIEEAKRWLNEINNSYSSFTDFCEAPSISNWHTFEKELFICSCPYYKASNGSFRGVLIIDDFDWVIKFNIDEENEEDSSKNESEHYRFAVEDGLDYFFAPSFYGGNFLGINFYLMKKAFTSHEEVLDEMSSNLRYSDEAYSHYESGLYEDDVSAIINIFGNYYSHEEVFNLLKFCEEYNIEDFHEGNIGYLGGYPVLIDYASIC